MKKKKSAIKRVTGLIVFEVSGANPNGSPDWDNKPRMTSDNHGWVTPVSLKRKIRGIMEDHNAPGFQELVEEMGIDPERFCIFESHYRGFNTTDAVSAMKNASAMANNDPDAFIDKYHDIRVFGTTALEGSNKKKKDKNNKKSKEENGEDESEQAARFIKTGCLTFSPAFSVAPIEVIEETITKKAPLDENHLANLQGTMAPMAYKFVDHGLYTCRFGINPHVAHYTNTTEEDIRVVKKILKHIFHTSTSCSRPSGSINFVHIWWKEHENSMGSFKDSEFYERLMPKRKGDPNIPSRSLEDYDIPCPDDVEDLA